MRIKKNGASRSCRLPRKAVGFFDSLKAPPRRCFFRGRRRGGEQISGGLRRKNRDIYGLRDGEAAAKN